MKHSTRRALGKLALWSYAVGIVGFYGIAYLRTRADESSQQDTGSGLIDVGVLPRVSVILPARDEERNILRSVTSLLEQDYPDFEAIVVDDASTDRTPAILREIAARHPHGERLRVLRVDELPPGWAGKPHAIHTGASAATGEWLLLTDADTYHAPEALRSAVERALRDGMDLFSYGTTQELPDFWGRVLMPMAYMGISMQYPAASVNDPTSPVAIANGQYILIKRALYDKIGGYASASLRRTVLDDRDLARATKQAGARMEMVDGRGLVSTRMYRGLREHWRGWGKNAYAGSRGGSEFFLLMIAGLPLVTIVPFALALGGLVTRHWRVAIAGGTTAAAALAYRAWLQRGMRVPWRYVATLPLAGAVFTGILSRGLWRSLTHRGVEWKGRSYTVR
ncbi:MAG TPA: glycosyltransferase, partial [Ktedonobacterales bacterium]